MNRLFDMINYTLLGLFAIVTVVPFIYIMAGSLATQAELMEKGFILFPTQISFDAYKFVFTTDIFLHSLLVTIYITAAGTVLNIVFTVLTAYPLARREMLGRKLLMFLIMFTMLFSGGMIPTFILVKELGMLDSLWSLMIPGLISAFNLIIIRSFFQQLPDGIEESAKIDGCNDLQILARIVLPLSMPAIATFSLFYAVTHWNSYFHAILYINDSAKWPIQVMLRQIVILSSGSIGDSSMMDSDVVIPPASVKMAVIVLATLPILVVYPFIQKHFAKGALMGSVKG